MPRQVILTQHPWPEDSIQIPIVFLLIVCGEGPSHLSGQLLIVPHLVIARAWRPCLSFFLPGLAPLPVSSVPMRPMKTPWILQTLSYCGVMYVKGCKTKDHTSLAVLWSDQFKSLSWVPNRSYQLLCSRNSTHSSSAVAKLFTKKALHVLHKTSQLHLPRCFSHSSSWVSYIWDFKCKPIWNAFHAKC